MEHQQEEGAGGRGGGDCSGSNLAPAPVDMMYDIMRLRFLFQLKTSRIREKLEAVVTKARKIVSVLLVGD